jgi:hypothetical protein
MEYKMRIKFILIILTCIIQINYIFAQRQKISLIQSTSVDGECQGWLLSKQSLPIINNKVQASQLIPIQSIDLVKTDRTGSVILSQFQEKEKLVYNLYTHSGRLINRFEIDWDYDLPIPIVLIDSKNERLFLIDLTGKISCRSFAGQIIWHKKAISDFEFCNENTYFAEFNDKQNELLTAFSQPMPDKKSSFRTVLVKMKTDGEIITTAHFDNYILSNFSVDHQGKYFVLMLLNTPLEFSDKPPQTVIINSNGEKILQSEGSFRKVVFIDEDKCLLMCKRGLKTINLKSKKIDWTRQIANTSQIYESMIYSDRGIIAAVKGTPKYSKGKLYFNEAEIEFIDLNSNLLNSYKMNQKKYLPNSFKLEKNGRYFIGYKKGYSVVGRD